MEFFPSLLTQGEGGVSILGCHWTEWDSIAACLEISAAGCCVCQRPVSCSWSLQTHCHLSSFRFWMALTLPFSFASTQSFICLSFSLSLSSFPLTPCLEHPSCHLWPCPIRPSPLVWCASLVWPFQERRTNRNGRRNRKRQGGGITDASGRWAEKVNESRCITWMHVIQGFPCILILEPSATDDSQATTA